MILSQHILNLVCSAGKKKLGQPDATGGTLWKRNATATAQGCVTSEVESLPLPCSRAPRDADSLRDVADEGPSDLGFDPLVDAPEEPEVGLVALDHRQQVRAKGGIELFALLRNQGETRAMLDHDDGAPVELASPSRRGATCAIMRANGAGKSTLMEMIAGSEMPDIRRVLHHGRTSWPLGFNGVQRHHEGAGECPLRLPDLRPRHREGHRNDPRIR